MQHAGLRSDATGLLWFGSRWGMPHRAQLRFLARGIRVVTGERELALLDWDDYRRQALHERTRSLPGSGAAQPPPERAWWVRPRFASAGPTAIEIGIRAANGDATRGERRWKLRDPVTSQIFAASKYEAGVVLQALCEYLAATPEAREGCGDPAKCGQLVKALRGSGIEGMPTKQDHLNVGHKGEARQAVRQAAEAHMRYFRGRPVSGEPIPTADELANIALQRLPSWAATGWTQRDKLIPLAADQLAITPWPFGVLRED